MAKNKKQTQTYEIDFTLKDVDKTSKQINKLVDDFKKLNINTKLYSGIDGFIGRIMVLRDELTKLVKNGSLEKAFKINKDVNSHLTNIQNLVDVAPRTVSKEKSGKRVGRITLKSNDISAINLISEEKLRWLNDSMEKINKTKQEELFLDNDITNEIERQKEISETNAKRQQEYNDLRKKNQDEFYRDQKKYEEELEKYKIKEQEYRNNIEASEKESKSQESLISQIRQSNLSDSQKELDIAVNKKKQIEAMIRLWSGYYKMHDHHLRVLSGKPDLSDAEWTEGREEALSALSYTGRYQQDLVVQKTLISEIKHKAKIEKEADIERKRQLAEQIRIEKEAANEAKRIQKEQENERKKIERDQKEEAIRLDKIAKIQQEISESEKRRTRHDIASSEYFGLSKEREDAFETVQLEIKGQKELVNQKREEYKLVKKEIDLVMVRGNTSEDTINQLKEEKKHKLEILHATEKAYDISKLELERLKLARKEQKNIKIENQKAEIKEIDPFQKEKLLQDEKKLTDDILQSQYKIEDLERDISSHKKNKYDKYKSELELYEEKVRLAEYEYELAKKQYNLVNKKDDIAAASQELKIKKEALDTARKNTQEFKKQREAIASTRKSLSGIISDFFSFEKIVARTSFVLTAKFSYDIIKFFQRLPKQAIESWVEFQDEISKTYALITDKSKVFKEQIETAVLDMSRTYGLAAKKVAAAMYEIVSAQVPLQYASQVLEQSIKLSTAGGTDIQGAARSLVQIANAYEISFDKMSRISDIAFQTIKYGQLTMEQYTEEMQKVISTSSIFSISQEEISAAIATMTINGIGATQAFTALNQMLMQIANPTKQATDLMSQLGISLSIRDIQEKGLGFALQELLPLLEATDQHGRELITILFKSRTGFKSVASLLQNIEQYGDYYIHMLDSAGATSDALAERTITVSHAMNKLKIEWENMLIMAAKSQDNKLIGFIDGLTKSIKWLSDNAHLLYLGLKMVVGQIGVFATIAVMKGLKAITSLKQGFITLTSVATTSAQAISAAWAQVTMGISILVQSIITLIHWMGEVARKAEKAKLDEMFNVKEANKMLSEANTQLDELTHNISKLEGMKKMISMYEQISQKQNKSNKEIERMDKLFDDVASTMKKMGIEIDNTGTRLERLAKYSAEINKELAKNAELEYRGTTMMSIAELNKSLSDYSLKKVLSAGDMLGHKVINQANQKLMYVSKLMIDAVDIARNKPLFVLENQIEEIIRISNAHIENIDDLMKIAGTAYMEESLKIKEGFIAVLSTMYQIQSGGMNLKLKDIEIPDFRETVHVGTVSEKSFVSQYAKILKEILGENIIDTMEAVMDAHQEALDDLNDDIDKFIKDKGIELDAQERKKLQEKINTLIGADFSEQIMGAYSTEMSRLSGLYDMMKSLDENNKAEEIFEQMNELHSAFTISALSMMESTEKLKNAGIFDDKEIKKIEEIGKYVFETIQSGYLSGIPSSKLPESLLGDMLGLSIRDIESYLNDIQNAAIDDSKTFLMEALEIYKAEELKVFEKNLKQSLGAKDKSEAFDLLLNQLSLAIDEGRITSRSQFKKTYQQILQQHKIIPTESEQKELDTLYPGVWKGVMDISDYKTMDDMKLDMANRTVQALQQTWSFYWDWETRKLQEQQQKKLDILEAEKKMMLANTLMSNEQRAIIEERFQERQRQLQEKLDKEMAKKKKQQAIFEATIDYAKGLIGIWASQLAKGNLLGATAFSALLTAIFGTQMAMIHNQKFASGGYTGSGYGRPDETGHRPAGIVHAGELVIDKKTLDRNFNEMTGLYATMKSGKSFDSAIGQYLSNGFNGTVPTRMGKFAQGGLVGSGGLETIKIDLGGIRTIDDVSLARLVHKGNRKMRIIND